MWKSIVFSQQSKQGTSGGLGHNVHSFDQIGRPGNINVI